MRQLCTTLLSRMTAALLILGFLALAALIGWVVWHLWAYIGKGGRWGPK